jgi:hypothetical protein
MEKLLRNIRGVTERPGCRETILKGDYIPDIILHGGRMFWDGMSSRSADGVRRVFPAPVSTQLKVMAIEGLWGDLSNTVMDWFRYSRLRDAIDGKGRPGEFLGVELWQPPERSARRGTRR